MKQQKRYRRNLIALLMGLCLLLSMAPAAAASTKSSGSSGSSTTSGSENISQAVTQSYNASASIQQGMIVQLEPKDASSVEALQPNDISDMLGVVVSSNDATLTLTPATVTKQQVFVATAGRYDVLVSDQEGPISSGDEITISAIAGIGMKATASQAVVLGKAVGSFNGTSNVISTMSLTNSTGKTEKVAIGEVPIDLDISHNPLASNETGYVPGFLAKTASTIASQPVSAARVYLGVLILFVSAVVTGNLLYSGVRSGMQAIGRNPLSRKSIIRSLVQTVIAGLIIFIIGIFAVYLLLKL